jgi:pimeloyl-ACP methyl ester carboxylesterase
MVLNRKKYKVLACMVVGVVVTICVISYGALRKLTYGFACDELRQKRNREAVDIRKNLFANYTICDVSFTTDDKLKLAGLLIKNKDAVYNVILCHGYRANKESLHDFIDVFHNANIMLFDFRAHGQSEGDLTTIGCHEYKDVIAAAEYMQRRIISEEGRKMPLILVGLSMGGAAALKAAAERPGLAQGLIVDSVYADLCEVTIQAFSAHSGLPQYPFLPVMEYMFEWFSGAQMRHMRPLDFVSRITCPILFIHSCQDEHTSPYDAVRLYASASTSGKSRLWIAPKAQHGFLIRDYFSEYKRKANAFLKHFVFGAGSK